MPHHPLPGLEKLLYPVIPDDCFAVRKEEGRKRKKVGRKEVKKKREKKKKKHLLGIRIHFYL
jgi:hypothetical protein